MPRMADHQESNPHPHEASPGSSSATKPEDAAGLHGEGASSPADPSDGAMASDSSGDRVASTPGPSDEARHEAASDHEGTGPSASTEGGGHDGGVPPGALTTTGDGWGDDPSRGEPVDEEGGGPIKSFLEHLEDLRWTLIRCSVSVFLGILACLTAGNFIISLLEAPLVRAQKARPDKEPVVVITMGTNILSRLPAKTFPLPGSGTNDVVLKVAPVALQGATVLALVPDTNPPPMAGYSMQVSLKTYSPGGGFTIAVQLAIFGGLTLSAPFVLYFLGQFILPALHVHEKKFLFRIAGASSFLFFAGIAFCYFVLLPITLGTTAAFSNWLGFSADEWRADEYISFCCWFLLGMGLSFQLPMVLLTLVKVGLLDVAGLAKYRAYFYVGILVIAGFVTPDGNPFTMMLMAAPLMGLYELSVVIAWFWARKERRAARA